MQLLLFIKKLAIMKMSQLMIYLSFIIHILFGNFLNSKSGLLIKNYRVVLMKSIAGLEWYVLTDLAVIRQDFFRSALCRQIKLFQSNRSVK